MARVGMNPARRMTSDYRPAWVTVAVLTYVPHLEGYFEQRLEVIKKALASLKANTTLPHDLLVFDNGSCLPVVDYLQELRAAGQVDYLILSRQNLGKIGAFQLIFNAAPGEIVAYADDDILFYPGWLEAHLEILDTFPKVGMVSGVPVRNAAGYAMNSLERLESQGAPGLSISRQRRIPDEWEVDWALSTGRDPAKHLTAMQTHQDVVLSKGGVEAIGSANHFQFLVPKALMLEILPRQWTGKLMGHMVELDQAVDELGYLRLSTVDRYVRHLGNVLDAADPDLAKLERIDVRKRSRHFLFRIPGLNRLLRALYNWLFQNIQHRR